MPEKDELITELLKQALDIREWLARLDTKIDQLNEIKRDVADAGRTADEALSLSRANKEAIAEIKANDRYKWGAILTILGFVVSVGIAYFSR
jgi:hypothetical protein